MELNRAQQIDRIEKFYERSKEQFYIDRNKTIEEVRKFAEGIAMLDPKLIDFEYPDLQPENLLPSLFKDEFIEEDYIRERQEALKIYNKFEELQDRLILEAQKTMGMM